MMREEFKVRVVDILNRQGLLVCGCTVAVIVMSLTVLSACVGSELAQKV
jgi:hypothetical protein